MALDRDHLLHLARLARLEIPDSDLDTLRGRLQSVLEYVDQLKKLNVDGVPPLDHAVDLTSLRRNDEPIPGLSAEAALSNAPAPVGPYFSVPRIIDAP